MLFELLLVPGDVRQTLSRPGRWGCGWPVGARYSMYVRVHEVSSRFQVAGYGWEYTLWVASMAVLAAEQVSLICGDENRSVGLTVLLAGWLVALGVG